MSRRSSRLDTLLRVRRIQEEVSRGRLAAELAAERKAEWSLEQARARYAEPTAMGLVATETTLLFLADRRYRGALAGSVRTAGAGVDIAAHLSVLARTDWSEAATRLTGLERLDDRAREVARTEQLAAEQRTSEESSSAKRQPGPASTTKGHDV